jgi:hypothetical protein
MMLYVYGVVAIETTDDEEAVVNWPGIAGVWENRKDAERAKDALGDIMKTDVETGKSKKYFSYIDVQELRIWEYYEDAMLGLGDYPVDVDET